MKILIDENLSPALVGRLADKGVAAEHIVHCGKASVSDPEVWQYAYEHDMVVVTLNVSDFILLASGSPLHAGLIVIRKGSLTREESWTLLEPVIDHLVMNKVDLMNQVVEVYEPGDFAIRAIPSELK